LIHPLVVGSGRRPFPDSGSDLSVIEKNLRNDLADNNALVEPTEMLLAGAWPWGTGVPCTDDDRSLVHRQVLLTLASTTLLGSKRSY